jgi:hypothetical protein
VPREWHGALDTGEVSSRAELARKQGVSRARVTQALRLLNLVPEVLDLIETLGDAILGHSHIADTSHTFGSVPLSGSMVRYNCLWHKLLFKNRILYRLLRSCHDRNGVCDAAVADLEINKRGACERSRECYGVQSRPIDSDSSAGTLARVSGVVGDQHRRAGLGTLLSKPK